MKKLNKLFWLWVVLAFVLILLIVFIMPVKINTKNDEDIFKTDRQTFSDDILYNGKTYTNAQKGNIFSSIEEAGIETDISFENLSDDEKNSFRSNLYEGYRLEYIYDGNIKPIYPRKYKRIIDYLNPMQYLLIGDYYLLFIDQENISTSHEWLFKNSSIKMPDMKSENIEKIEEYIGVPYYRYSSTDCELFIKDLTSEHDLHNVTRRELTNSSFIDEITDEFRKEGNIDSFVISATKENKTIINKAQSEIDNNQKDCFSKENCKVVVYYKIYFKDKRFPFRLILTERKYKGA